jgi:hypothetical protein
MGDKTMIDGATGSCTSYCGRILVLLAALLLAGCSPRLAWNTFHDETGGFSVEFPGKVEQPPGGVQKGVPGESKRGQFFCSAANSMGYDVSYMLQSNSPEFIASQFAKLMHEKLAPDSRYTDLDASVVKLGEHQGVELVFTEVKGDIKAFRRTRIFHVPTGSYYLAVESAKTDVAFSPDINRFFDSFKLDTAK